MKKVAGIVLAMVMVSFLASGLTACYSKACEPPCGTPCYKGEG